jgi:hypothetical protein
VVNLGVVIAFHTWRIRHPQAARDSDPVE